MSAGCLFTDGTYVLAGLQIKNEKPILSGFGGKQEEFDECSIDTAIRETLEELFGLDSVPQELVQYLMKNYIPRSQFTQTNYLVLVYTFEDLADFLQISKGFGIQSPLYPVLPTDLLSLLFTRKPQDSSEICSLALLPISADMNLCPHFLKDLKMLSQNSS